MKRVLRPLALVLTITALAGCSAIPTAGPVNTTAPQGAAQPDTQVFTPVKPTPGAQPADIVRGFLAAATGPQDDYRIARQYLTRTFARHWDPHARVLVSTGAVAVTGNGQVAAVPIDATIDSAGTFTPATPALTVKLPFSLERENGEWRIASTQNGVVLPSPYLPKLFRALPLDYFTPGFDGLVPDLRWFPASDDASDQMVRRLLAGAAGPVAAPVTATAFPDGTSLARHVQVVGAAATVDLRVATGTPNVTTLMRMRRQLESTLAGQGGIRRVELEIDGVPQSVSSASVSSGGPAPDDPLVLQRSKFGYLSGGDIAPYAKLGAAVVKAKPSAVTASDLLGRAAVLTTSGDVAVVAPTGKPAVVDRRPGLIAPTLDADGWTWSVPSSRPQALQAAKDGRTVTVPSGLAAATVTTIETSRDGTRLLTVLDSRSTPRVVVSGILRSSDGTPIGLSGVVYEAPLPAPDGTVLGATWADSGSIAVLVQRTDGGEGVVLQQLGGLSSQDGVLSKATAIVGGATPSDLTVLAGGSVEQTSNGNTVWQSIATGVDLIAVQH